MKPDYPRARLHTRIGLMLAGWGTVGLCYSVGRLTPHVAHVLNEGILDTLVPFDASAVWLYLSFFLLVPAAYLFAAPDRLTPLTRSMQLSAAVAGAVFLAWPTTIVYPAIPPATIGGTVLTALAGADSPRNCLPSLHGALTLLCVVALWERKRPWRNAAVLVWGLAVMWSVVAARRHLSIDLGAGVMLGAVCSWFATRQRAVEVPTEIEFNSSPENHP
ncbi:inositol phosphorylceramide synthase [Paraburkholderia sp. Tr-20389]|uniref:phosphatase PAP2 family protein n=1 Tax=Paraburkholderia sp. Tr-20389 TaxID=2703903 RepID=UPI001F11EEA7|nr:phosphatase PAP2 family protein [Paraburkholderia sp. Tr-20389]MBN3751635.1 inositol phosphorylceramide synthase [Paraburkholderia sp. Tr-20389]